MAKTLVVLNLAVQHFAKAVSIHKELAAVGMELAWKAGRALIAAKQILDAQHGDWNAACAKHASLISTRSIQRYMQIGTLPSCPEISQLQFDERRNDAIELNYLNVEELAAVAGAVQGGADYERTLTDAVLAKTVTAAVAKAAVKKASAAKKVAKATAKAAEPERTGGPGRKRGDRQAALAEAEAELEEADAEVEAAEQELAKIKPKTKNAGPSKASLLHDRLSEYRKNGKFKQADRDLLDEVLAYLKEMA